MHSIVSTISSDHQIMPRFGPLGSGSQDRYFISTYHFMLSSVTLNLVACDRPLVSLVITKDGRANFVFSNDSGFVVNTCPIQSSSASLSQRPALPFKTNVNRFYF